MSLKANAETIEVDDLDGFVKLLTKWHANKIAVLNHMLLIPEGSDMTSGDQTIKLEGDLMAGFKAGLEVALMELGTLPFAFEEEGAEPAQPSDATTGG